MPLTNLEQLAYDALISQDAATTELFKELGNKAVGNWGIINQGGIDANKAIAKLKEIKEKP